MKILVILLFAFLQGKSQEFFSFKQEMFIQNQDTLNYRILYPEKIKTEKKYPLILFLHGAGERGADNQKQLIHGAKLFSSQKMRENYPAIAVFPQCPKNIMWTHRIIFPDANHNSWDPAFDEPELLKWLFNNKKHR